MELDRGRMAGGNGGWMGRVKAESRGHITMNKEGKDQMSKGVCGK